MIKDILMILMATIKIYKQMKKDERNARIAEILKRKNDKETNAFVDDLINNDHGIV